MGDICLIVDISERAPRAYEGRVETKLVAEELLQHTVHGQFRFALGLKTPTTTQRVYMRIPSYPDGGGPLLHTVLRS